MMSVRQLPLAVWYRAVSTMAQWLFPWLVKPQELMASIAPRPCVHIVSRPAACDRHAVARAISRRRAANTAALLERCPRAIMRVTSAELVTSPSSPTVRMMMATITSMMVNPRSLFMSAHHLAQLVDDDGVHRSGACGERDTRREGVEPQPARVELHRVEGRGDGHLVERCEHAHRADRVDRPGAARSHAGADRHPHRSRRRREVHHAAAAAL